MWATPDQPPTNHNEILIRINSDARCHVLRARTAYLLGRNFYQGRASRHSTLLTGKKNERSSYERWNALHLTSR